MSLYDELWDQARSISREEAHLAACFWWTEAREEEAGTGKAPDFSAIVEGWDSDSLQKMHDRLQSHVARDETSGWEPSNLVYQYLEAMKAELLSRGIEP